MSRAYVIRAALFFFACLLIFTGAPVSAATDCSKIPGTREATADDAVVKNGQIPAGTCWNPNDPGIGQTAEEAKAYLRSLPRQGSATDDGNIAKLNTAFATCSSKFLKDFQQRYGGVTIRSAYRSPAYDAAMCVNNPACGALANNPNPMGNHQRGLAMDIAANSGKQSDLWDFARSNPGYGVCFPFTGEGGGFKDTVHMILAGGPGSEGNGPGCRGVTKACDGSNFNPNEITSSPIGSNGPVGSSAPTGGTNNPFANPNNPTQQGQMCMVSTSPIVLVPCGQQAPQAPAPAPSAPQSPTPTSQGPTPTGGTSAAPRYTPDFPLPVPNSFVAPSQYTFATATAPTSVTRVTTYTSTTTGTALPARTAPVTALNDDLNRTEDLNVSTGGTNSDDLAVNTLAENSVDVRTVGATQTFTREEPVRIAPSPTASTTAVPPSNTLIVSLLTTLRNLLVTFVNVLKTQQTAGFHAPWQVPGTAPEY